MDWSLLLYLPGRKNGVLKSGKSDHLLYLKNVDFKSTVSCL